MGGRWEEGKGDVGDGEGYEGGEEGETGRGMGSAVSTRTTGERSGIAVETVCGVVVNFS